MVLEVKTDRKIDFKDKPSLIFSYHGGGWILNNSQAGNMSLA